MSPIKGIIIVSCFSWGIKSTLANHQKNTTLYLMAPQNHEIPANPTFISNAGFDPRYTMKNTYNNISTLPHIQGQSWADHPKGKINSSDDYRLLPTISLAAYYFTRAQQRSALTLLQDPKTKLAINPYATLNTPSGRGFYGQWGPNYTADPLITRYGKADKNGTSYLEMLVVQRPQQEWFHSNQPIWALPGGMKDQKTQLSKGLLSNKVKYETSHETIMREGKEETGLDFAPLASLFTAVYEGYVNDPRATRHSWPETHVMHLHLFEITNGEYLTKYPQATKNLWSQRSPTYLALKTALESERLAPQDAQECPDARWLQVTADNVNNLFASHGLFVKMALQKTKLPLHKKMT